MSVFGGFVSPRLLRIGSLVLLLLVVTAEHGLHAAVASTPIIRASDRHRPLIRSNSQFYVTYEEKSEKNTEFVDELSNSTTTSLQPSSTAVPTTTTTTTEQKEEDPLQKCYDVLSTIVGDDDSLSQDEYLVFLSQISNGDVYFEDWAELSSLFLLIFITAACTYGQDCVQSPPVVALDGEAGSLEFLCYQTLRHTYTKAELSFEYTVRFSGENSSDDIQECLEGATERLLLDQLAQCDEGSEPNRLLLLLRQQDITTPGLLTFLETNGVQLAQIRRAGINAMRQKGMEEPPPHAVRGLQQEQQNQPPENDEADVRTEPHGCSDNDGPEECPYDVNVSILRMTDFPCDPVAIAPDARCVLVQSRAVMATDQLQEPYAADLREQMVTVLRDAINGNQFENYLPDGCRFAQ